MGSAKVDIEWNGKGNFSVQSQKMKALLLHQGYVKVLDEPGGKKMLILKELNKLKLARALYFCIYLIVSLDNQKRQTIVELWVKLEFLYKTKTLPNRLMETIFQF